MTSTVSIYKGSPHTAALVKAELLQRYGADVAREYSPDKNVFTYQGWLERKRVVRKKERSIRSYTFVEKKDASGIVVNRYKKTTHLFHYLQTESLI